MVARQALTARSSTQMRRAESHFRTDDRYLVGDHNG